MKFLIIFVIVGLYAFSSASFLNEEEKITAPQELSPKLTLNPKRLIGNLRSNIDKILKLVQDISDVKYPEVIRRLQVLEDYSIVQNELIQKLVEFIFQIIGVNIDNKSKDD